MISWMQKHNKYLVWTIWIATIAFIGAGFVGWGSYNVGSNAGNVAKVGSIGISQSKLNMAYSNLYAKYNEMFQGKLDEKQAKEMGLTSQAFNNVESQALMLNFAKDAGIIASDAELKTKIQSIKAFQKDGKFSKEIYDNYVLSQRKRAKDIEEIMREELIVEKTISLLNTQSLPLEVDSLSMAMHAADKIKYKILTQADVTYVSDEAKAKAYWESEKNNYMTTKEYDLSLVWTEGTNIAVTDAELKVHYEANAFNYTNAEGKQLSLEEANEALRKDVKLKKTKKSAQKAYIAFKKGSTTDIKTETLSVNDDTLTPEIWKEINSKSVGDILKPKIVGEKYVSIKINAIKEPAVMSFEEAKDKVTYAYDKQERKKALLTLAETTLKSFPSNDAIESEFLTLQKNVTIKSLNSEESLQFLQKLFTSNKEKGIISVLEKVIVYDILEQKILTKSDVNQTEIDTTVKSLKKKLFDTNLHKMLAKLYPTETYMEGLKK